ncbi:MAG: phytanoyl-CoA dioxygenase family protein [Planctomycetes bacterium]|nr:phytanoyl-CoA dioxygenase family protein [Planctomycetota bacterium]
MTTPLSPTDVAGFFQNGYTILRGILPASLITDLRRESDKAAALVRQAHGGQPQRFQPISAYAESIDTLPFRHYADLPALHHAFRQVLGPDAFYGRLDVMGVFIEPPVHPWSITWHRDINRQNCRFETEAEYADFVLDWDSLNQINAALYDDHCTWYVPGSHLRTQDSPAELAASRGPDPDREKRLREGGDLVALEQMHLEHTRSMPAAVQVHLHAGDLLLYRAYGWHCGNYLPYQKRATILDVLYSPAYFEWRHAWLAGHSPKWKPNRSRRLSVAGA